MNDFEEHDSRAAFEKKYVLRRDYERDLKLAKHDGIVAATTFCILILPPVLIMLFMFLRAIGWIEPGEFGIQ
jgi:hypothetical protein